MNRYSTTELAELLGVSDRAIRYKLKDIPRYKRSQRGGGWEYDPTDLPADIQRRIVATRAVIEKAEGKRQETEGIYPNLLSSLPKSNLVGISQPSYQVYGINALVAENGGTAIAVATKPSPANVLPFTTQVPSSLPRLKTKVSATDRRDAKLHILALLSDFIDQHRLGLCDGRYEFAQAYNRRAIEIADWVRAAVPLLSVPSLARWKATLKGGNINGLAGKYGNRKSKSFIDADVEIRTVIEGMLLYRATHIEEELRYRFPEKKLPNLRTIQRWIKFWKQEHPQEWAMLQSKELFNSKYRAAHGSLTENISYALQELQVDATKGDIILEDGTRYSLLLIEDTYSRRLKFFVTKTSNAKALVQGLLRRVILEWGIPESIKTDRGKEFLSSYFLGCLEALNIDHKKCHAFSPWQKGLVERAFGTNTRDLLERLKGYCGHNVAERRAIESRRERILEKDAAIELRMSPQELQQALDNWCRNYEQQPHRGEGLEGKSPLQRWAESPEGIKKISDERTLDILLAEAPNNGGIRTVQKGGIQVNGNWYADFDGEWARYIGHSVQVKYDPFGDAGKIYVFKPGLGGEFLFIATDPTQLGEDRQEKAALAHKVQREKKAVARSLRKLSKTIVGDAAAFNEGNLVPFPLQAYAYNTAALEVAQDAAIALHSLEPVSTPALSNQEYKRYEREAKRLDDLEALAHRRKRQQPQESSASRYQRLWFEKKEGGVISAEDEEFMTRYELLPGGRAVKACLESS